MTPVILPTAPPTGIAPTAQASQAAVLATVPDPPPAAARLDPGSIITGTVLGRDPQGLVTIRTDKGVLALATNANLPPGSTVSLEVRVAGTKLQLVVLSVELPKGAPSGLPSDPGGTAPIPVPAPGSRAAAPTPAAILAALSGGHPVMATVVHAAAPSKATALDTTGGRTQNLPSGPAPSASVPSMSTSAGAPSAGASSTTAQVPLPGPSGPTSQLQPAAASPGAFDEQAPGSAGGPAPAATGMAASSPADPEVRLALPRTVIAGLTAIAVPPDGEAPLVPLPTTARALAVQPGMATAPAQLPAGTEVQLRIVGAALPGSPAPDPPARPAGAPPVIAGTVTAETPAGHPVLDTPAGRMVLAVKATLPAGTMLLVELPSSFALAAAAAAPSVSTPDQAMLRLAQGWPALAEALAHLDAANEPAGAALAARLPQPGPRLAAGLMTVMTQLASGEVGEWLGPALREALERIGKRDLVDRLRGEFQQLSRLASEPAGGDWRVMFLPLHDGRELHQINLYLRGKRRGSDGETLDTGTRFVVEVDMTRLGPLQLDGLVHGSRFDLMLRSRTPLSPAMRRDIEAIFDEARGIGGYTGTIGFQVAASFPVAPLDQAKRKRPAGGVVV